MKEKPDFFMHDDHAVTAWTTDGVIIVRSKLLTLTSRANGSSSRSPVRRPCDARAASAVHPPGGNGRPRNVVAGTSGFTPEPRVAAPVRSVSTSAVGCGSSWPKEDPGPGRW